MTRKLDMTAKQVQAICNGAEKAGFIPEIKIGNAVVRLVPEYLAGLKTKKEMPKGEGHL